MLCVYVHPNGVSHSRNCLTGESLRHETYCSANSSLGVGASLVTGRCQAILFPTEAGTPQGGIISPTLANRTLDGLEAQLEARFGSKGSRKAGMFKVNMVRYADDFVITGSSKELLENEVKPLVVAFLATRGLQLSKEKTRITHSTEGFDFLGQNVRNLGGKIIITPSKKNIQAFKNKIKESFQEHKTAKQQNLIAVLNPVIRGWANYHRAVCASKTFASIDAWLWLKTWQWAKRRHPNKNVAWIKHKYFATVGSRHWVFTTQLKESDEERKRVTLIKASDTRIRRHTKIQGEANPLTRSGSLTSKIDSV
jgi:RNA-directed DNA polymerase